MEKIRTYSELITYKTFEERYVYLRLSGKVGLTTFGHDRIFNQKFYTSVEWQRVRDYIIARDIGCDLGIDDYSINNGIYIHHMNPITLDDITDKTDILLNPEFLITTSLQTHNAIHYGYEPPKNNAIVERTKNDTCPWRH